MKARDIMTRDPKTVRTWTTLRDAAAAMKATDCGILPVLDLDGTVVGMITDRDICVHLAERDVTPSTATTGEVVSGRVYSVHPDDDTESALQSMRAHLVRRLPVMDAYGKLHGILSLNDLFLAAREVAKPGFGVTLPEVVETMQAICSHGKPHEVILV